MDGVRLGRILRMVRLRRGWRLADISQRARLSTATLGRHELGAIGWLDGLERHAAALDMRVELRLVGRGVDLARLTDDEHAAIVNVLAAAYAAAGCEAQAEVSYSEWGERGRFDLLAVDQAGSRLVMTEVKTELGDLQEVLGSLDVKARLAHVVARRLGWVGREVRIVLAVASTERNRRVVADHSALFAGYVRHQFRGGEPGRRTARELLWIPPAAAGRRMWLAGRRQVR